MVLPSVLRPLVPVATRRASAPAILARRTWRRRGRRWARRLGHVAAWTGAWTLFQWWAVIGWPEQLDAAPAALLVSGITTLVGIAVWHDVDGLREPAAGFRRRSARIIPLRPPEGPRPGVVPVPPPAPGLGESAADAVGRTDLAA